MKKLYLSNIIEKYHLGGLVEKVKISTNSKNLTTKFISINKNLIGEIQAPSVELDDCEFGIYDTSQLLKLIGITQHDITLGIEKQGKIANKLLIADNEYNLEYILADTMLTPAIPIFDEPDYEIIANIDKEFIDKFIKAKKALDSDIFTIEPSYDTLNNDVLLFTLGGLEGYTNKVSFFIPIIQTKLLGNAVKFPINEFNEILLANKDLTLGKLYVSQQGVLKIEFENEEKIKVYYVLIGKE